MKCDTCGKEHESVARVVIDNGYNRSMAKPLWNCPDCFQKKEDERVLPPKPGVAATKKRAVPALDYAMLCEIERAWSSGERLFTVPLADGTEDGDVAPLESFRHRDGTPVKDSEPADGKSMEALLEVFLSARSGNQVAVGIPGGRTLTVDASRVMKVGVLNFYTQIL